MTGGLVGRDADLQAVSAFVQSATDRGGALLLSGDPGVGKSALLDAAARTATALGAKVLRASGAEFGPEVGLSGLDQLLAPLQADLGSLDDAQRTGLSVALGLADGPPPSRLVVFNATLQLLRRVGQEQPVLVVVDDVQWLDRSTADVLAFVARRLAASRVGLLGAHRTGTAVSLVQAGLPEHQLAPLDRVGAAGLLEARSPGLAPRARARVLAEAEGNPLALVELPAVLTPAQRADREALPSVLPLGTGLQRLFTTRVADLPRPTRALLLLGALHGTGELTVLRAAARDSGGLDELAPAERAGLVAVEENSDRLTFRHPLVRSTVVDGSTAIERRRAHRALAEALPDQPERQAWHLADATPHPDEDVAARLEHSAQASLRRGDAVRAVEALSRAADLSPAPDEQRRRRAEAAYLGADVTGRLRKVPELLRDDDGRDGDPRSLTGAMAEAYLLLNGTGDVDAAHSLLLAAIGRHVAGRGTPDPALAEALHTLLLICFFGGREELWAPFDAAIAGLGAGAPTTLLLTHRTMARPGRTAASVIGLLDAAIEELGHVVDPVTIVRIAMAGFYVDRLPACRDAVLRVLEDGRRGGAVASAIDAAMCLSFDHLGGGEWQQAQQYAMEGLDLCGAHGYELLAWPGRLALALLAALRGEEETVQRLTEQMTAWAEPRRVGVVLCYARHARALAALGRGDFDLAYHDAAAISPPGTVTSHVAHALPVALDLIEAAVHSGRLEEAAAHVTAMEQAHLPDLSPRLALVTAGGRALVERDAATGALFERALAVPGAERWPFELARVHLAHGELLRRRRDTAGARTELRTALAGFRRLGAQPWAARAWAELRAAGEVRAVATPSGAPPLTAQELQIASMAASGMTNKEIADRLYLSHRTVGAHLYRVFPKLGITSRAALRDALPSTQHDAGPGADSGD